MTEHDPRCEGADDEKLLADAGDGRAAVLGGHAGG